MVDHVGINRPVDVSTASQGAAKVARQAQSRDWLDLIAPQSSLPPGNGHGGGMADVVLDLVVVGMSEGLPMRETISLPWRLSANGRMEQAGLSLSTGGLASSAASLCSQLQPIAGIATTPAQSLQHFIPIGAPPKDQVCFPFPSAPRPRADVPAHVAQCEAGADAASLPGLAENWAQRMVRVLSDDRGELSIWVRDYTLRGRDEHAVVGAIREFCGRNGVRVEKIAINGHVLWNSHSVSTAERV